MFLKDLCRALRGFCRGEEDKDFKLLADIEEAVFDLGRNKNDAARLHHLLLGTHTHFGVAAHYVVCLVFFMGLLRVRAPSGKNVNARAQSWDTKKFLVELTRLCALSGNRGQIEKPAH
jgi:hypothetical protein